MTIIIAGLIAAAIITMLRRDEARASTSWETLGARWRAAEEDRVRSELETFTAPIWRHRWHRYWDTITLSVISRWRRLAQRALPQHRMWLATVAEYGPKIAAEAKAYESAFNEWERWNRPGGEERCETAMRRERIAWTELERLDREVAERLTVAGCPFSLRSVRNLIVSKGQIDRGDTAAVYAENVERFWTELEVFLRGRTERLERMC